MPAPQAPAAPHLPPDPAAMQDLSRRYPVWFCDVWGVIHNGYTPFSESVATLARHRAAGGTVILLTNSPRSRIGVEDQLRGIGVDKASHDLIVTSGDVTRDLIRKHGGKALFHLGPSRDHSILDGLDVSLVEIPKAHAVLCTGLFDDLNDRLEDYDALLADLRHRRLAMICANPDKIVRKGDRILYCAGMLAERYAAIGGDVLMAGKPFQPIYDLAMTEAGSLRGRPIAPGEVLAIGDGPETDIKGAADFGLDALLVAEGITDSAAGLDAAEASVKALVPGARIVATVRQLTWS
ncbi:MAG: TIGR01459 family HAD-type hydrolase [Hyphomicrobiales bacterium]